MSFEDSQAVIFDAGSQNFKVGFSGDSFPKTIFPSVVGRFRKSNLIDGFPDIYCGKEAVKNRGFSILNWPIRNGLVENWDDMEKLWHHAFFKEIFAAPDDSKVLHSINPLYSLKDKEMMTEILFETFNVRALSVMTSPVLVLHASGRTTGLTWESGSSLSLIAPVYEGFPIYHAIKNTELSGDMITKVLQSQLITTGYTFTTPKQIDILEDIKKTLCYVEKEEECYRDKTKIPYTLPDGTVIQISDEKFMCAETFFKPSLCDLRCPSIVDSIISSIDTSELDIKSMLYENIVIGGGNTMFSGLKGRLEDELSNRMKSANIKVKVEAEPCRENAAWLGGSILATLSSMNDYFIKATEYEEHGPQIIHQGLL